jgi:hypothetical protein
MDRAYSFPIIHVEATRSCNLHCGICMAGCNDPGVRERSAQAELTYQEIVERILKPGRKLGARHIQYSGGEFLLRNDALDLIRAAAALGYAPRVLTNGTLITEELLAEIKRVGGPQFVLVFGLNSVIGERLNLGTRDVGREVVFRALDLCKRHRVGRHVVVNVGSFKGDVGYLRYLSPGGMEGAHESTGRPAPPSRSCLARRAPCPVSLLQCGQSSGAPVLPAPVPLYAFRGNHHWQWPQLPQRAQHGNVPDYNMATPRITSRITEA